MDSFAASHLVAAALAAGAALAATLAWHRSSTRDLLRREADSVRERDALLDGERELRARLHAANETLRLRAEVLQRVLAASGELKAHLPLDAVLANVARAASRSLGYRRVLLSLHDRADGLLVPRAHVGLPDAWPRLRELRLPVERLAGPGGGGAAPPPSPLASTLTEEDAAGVVSVPLVAAGQLVGVLELSGADPAAGAGAVDPVVLDHFARQAVTAIRLARAYETTRLGSLRDSLTGLANHGHFQETLYRELTRHERSHESLVLLLVDLDDFKAVNDRFGHPAGDAVLKAVVARLLDSVREMDTVSRYGGEEFAVILPQTDTANGMRVAERLRKAVAASPVPAGLPEPVPMTVSIGVAVYPADGTAKGPLVECADQALYAAKRTGKNRVVRFTKVPPSAEALLTERT